MDNFLSNQPPIAEDQTVYTQRGPLSVPLNLAQWVDPPKIVTWVHEAVANLDRNRPEAEEFVRLDPNSRPHVMLALLVFSYATQVFTSEEIVRACHEDEHFQALCHGEAPFVEELDRFRRKNRLLLEHVLGEILLRAVREKYVHLGKLPPGMEYGIHSRAIDQVDIARHMNTLDE